MGGVNDRDIILFITAIKRRIGLSFNSGKTLFLNSASHSDRFFIIAGTSLPALLLDFNGKFETISI